MTERNHRCRQVVKCKLGTHIDEIRQGLVAVLQPSVSRMVVRRVLFKSDPMSLTAWLVLQVRPVDDGGGGGGGVAVGGIFSCW